MKTLSLSACFLVLCAGSIAQELERPSIPEGVKYRFLDDDRVGAVQRLVRARFAQGPSGVAELLVGECMCAPGFWKLAPKSQLKGAVEKSFEIPNAKTGKLYRLAGAVLRQPQDLSLVAEGLSRSFGTEPTVRRLTALEIRRMWVVIPFDIEEPVFVLESGDLQFVICLESSSDGTKWTVWWIDDLSGYDWGDKNEKKKAAEPGATDNPDGAQ